MTELQLIAALKARDPEALKLFRQQYGPLMRYVMAPILSDDREKEECLSDLCLKVWTVIGSFDPDKGSFGGWLTVLTRNAALNRARAAHKHQTEDLSPQLADPAPGPETLVLRKEQLTALRRVLEQLPARDRTLFYRKYWYQQPVSQIAAETGLTLRAVEGRLYRIRRQLQKALGGEDL